mmetsp:Transcript_23562/g.36845  ORF Transcript_23562/g.36845 Transcript_23562/m.36845 type:complete len:241 (-) Transcript_23562:32-754(-)
MLSAAPAMTAGLLSAFICPAPLHPLVMRHQGSVLRMRRWGWNMPGCQRSRAIPAPSRSERIGALKMDLATDQMDQDVPVENKFPIKPRAAVAVCGCRVTSSGSMDWLLIKRGKEPNLGEWSLPGGSVELGEKTLDAARRELHEETRIPPHQSQFFPHSFMTSDVITKDKTGRLLFHYVIAQMFAEISTDAIPVASDDAMEVGWFTTEDIRSGLDGQVSQGVGDVVARAERLREAGCLDIQ